MKNSWLNGLFMCALLLVWGADALAATCTSNAGARNWNTAASWNCGHVPAGGDSVIVPNGSTVTLDVDTNALASLQIDSGGTLTVAAGANFDIYLGGNLVNNGTINFIVSGSTNAIYLAGAGVTSTFSGSGSWQLDRIDLNGNVIACTGTCKVELSGSPNLQFFNATPFSGQSATNTVNALGNSTATVTLALAGNQTISTTGVKYPNLVLAGSGNKTPSAGTLNILGSLTVSAGTTYPGNTNNPAVFLAGNFTNSGTFTSGTGVFTFNGSASQALTGATTFTNMTVNNASGLSLSSGNVTVSTVLTLSSGNITTNANTLITTASCAASVSRTSGHVVGNLRKAIPAGASTCTFEVGSGSNYTPVVTVFVAGTGAGNITASTTGTEHGSIASSGINSTKSVNRFWTLTNGGVTLPAAGFSATFNYINGSPVDFDSIATPANFIVERWDGTNWFPTTLNAGCTSTPVANLCKQVNTLTATTFGDFTIGEPLAGFNGAPGAFNVFETTTTAGSVLGRLYTKRLGAGTFAVAIVAVSNNAVNAAPSTAALTVDVIDASPTGGTLTASSNCRTTWTTVIQTQTVPAAVGWASGRVNVNITAPVQAARNARIRVTQGANIGCSTDNFTIRPQAFTVTSTNATQTNTSGTPAIKTGANFNLTAASAAGYDGAPSIDNTKVVGTPSAGTIGGGFSAAPVGTGTATGASFFYSEVGNFGLNTNAVYDSSFTGVDQSSDCTADFSNSLVGGQYGCSFGSTAIAQTLGTSGFGRFIPDHFALTAAGSLTQACGGFSYLGQSMSFAGIKIEARNASNVKTSNYAGAYAKLSPASFSAFGFGARDTGGGGTNLTGGRITGATSGNWATGELTLAVGTFSIARAASPDGAFGATKIGIAPADSDSVTLQSSDFDIDVDGAGGNDHARVGGADTLWRFGRLFVPSTFGTQNLDLNVPIEVQFWTGAQWQRNVLDSCTSIATSNLALGNYSASGTPLTSINLPQANATVSTAITSGLGQIKVIKPSGAATGAVGLAIKLGTGTSAPTVCGAWNSSTNPNPVGAGVAYLQVQGTCSANYDKDPVGTINFGVTRNRFIYNRENY